jgi:hypothetical protein
MSLRDDVLSGGLSSPCSSGVSKPEVEGCRRSNLLAEVWIASHPSTLLRSAQDARNDIPGVIR